MQSPESFTQSWEHTSFFLMNKVIHVNNTEINLHLPNTLKFLHYTAMYIEIVMQGLNFNLKEKWMCKGTQVKKTKGDSNRP